MARLFITGHRGYIGKALWQLLQDKYNLVGYDLQAGEDILDYPLLASRVQACRPDVVIHLAALSSIPTCNSQPAEALRVNQLGTENVVRAALAAGCRKFIYASTCSVYGTPSTLPTSEDDNLAPTSSYGRSKAAGEAVLQQYPALAYIVLRLFNVVGGCQPPNNDRLFAALASGQVVIYGNDYPTADGTGERDYVSLADVGQAFLAAVRYLLAEEPARLAINICSQQATSVDQLVHLWRQLHGPVVVHYGPRRPGDIARIVGSNQRAQHLLGWIPQDDLPAIIRAVQPL
jgi:UDP-glucose 4-epimerase